MTQNVRGPGVRFFPGSVSDAPKPWPADTLLVPFATVVPSVVPDELAPRTEVGAVVSGSAA